MSLQSRDLTDVTTASHINNILLVKREKNKNKYMYARITLQHFLIKTYIASQVSFLMFYSSFICEDLRLKDLFEGVFVPGLSRLIGKGITKKIQQQYNNPNT